MVVAALEQGRQALLVRRGGLDDPGRCFTAPGSGSVSFHCKFHAQMTGTISIGGAGAGDGASSSASPSSGGYGY